MNHEDSCHSGNPKDLEGASQELGQGPAKLLFYDSHQICFHSLLTNDLMADLLYSSHVHSVMGLASISI